MKNKLKSLALATMLATTGAIASTNNLQKIKDLNIFQGQGLQITAIKDQGSLYQIKGASRSGQHFDAFVTKDFKEIIFGKGFDTTTKKPLIIPINTEKYKKNAEYTIGHGKDEYILFTDPECPYCHKFEKVLPLISKHAKFYVYLFPLSFHQHSKAMSYYIMSQKTDAEKAKAIHAIAYGATAYKNAKFSIDELNAIKKRLENEKKLATEIGVSGTPSIYDANGKMVQWPDLLKKYNIKQPVDMDGIKFLENNNLEVSVNKSSKTPLYVFASLDNKKSISKLKRVIRKYSKKHAVKLFLKIDPNSKSKYNALAIYAQKDNASRAKLLKRILNGKSLDKKSLSKAKNLTKDEETKFLPVVYIMQRMHIKSNDDVVLLSNKGKILK